MRIDFSSLTMLVGPRFRRLKAEGNDREKLARSHMRRAKGPKNHSTNRERSREMSRKAAAIAKYLAERAEARSIYIEQVRAYWRGERDEHP